MPPELTIDDLETALGGDEDRLTVLIDAMTPVIHVRAARVLLRNRPVQAPQGVRQDIEDLVQDVLLALFADHAKILRDWNPECGLSLLNFVGLVTERRVASTLRSGKKTWREALAPNEDLDRAETRGDAERRAVSRDQLRVLLSRLREELSDLGWTMFRLIFVEERSVDEIGRLTRMKPAAIYAWRSRLRNQARTLFHSFEADFQPSRRIPGLNTGDKGLQSCSPAKVEEVEVHDE